MRPGTRYDRIQDRRTDPVAAGAGWVFLAPAKMSWFCSSHTKSYKTPVTALKTWRMGTPPAPLHSGGPTPRPVSPPWELGSWVRPLPNPMFYRRPRAGNSLKQQRQAQRQAQRQRQMQRRVRLETHMKAQAKEKKRKSSAEESTKAKKIQNRRKHTNKEKTN